MRRRKLANPILDETDDRFEIRTLPGKGVKRIEESEKSHFFRVDVAQWDSIIDEFEQSLGEDA